MPKFDIHKIVINIGLAPTIWKYKKHKKIKLAVNVIMKALTFYETCFSFLASDYESLPLYQPQVATQLESHSVMVARYNEARSTRLAEAL